jgi:hypothetical protein
VHYFDAMVLRAPKLENMGKRLRSVNKLLDLEERFREMDEYGDYRQFISLPTPIEEIAAANLHDVDAAVREAERAVDCGARRSDLHQWRRPHLDSLRSFYADTALFGGHHGLRCGLEFFGSARLVFASDTPFGPIGSTRDRPVDLRLPQKENEDIAFRNAERLLGMALDTTAPSQHHTTNAMITSQHQ